MLNVDKDLLKRKFKASDWGYVFKQAEDISDFLVSQKFRIFDIDIKNDMVQECLLNFWKKIIGNKCDPDKNVFAFIWKNSTFRILEILRKERKRKSIASFCPLDEYDDYIIYQRNLGRKYVPKELQEVWE